MASLIFLVFLANYHLIMGASSVQTLTILGGYGSAGEQDPYAESSQDGGLTWGPAYYFEGHPWGYIDGTNQWVNFDPSPYVGLNTYTLYRIRFSAPDDFSDIAMTYSFIADNYASLWLNDVQVCPNDEWDGGGISPLLTIDPTILVPGENVFILELGDAGGWVGFNYRIDVVVTSEQEFVIAEAGACAGNEYVSNGECTACPAGTINEANDDPTNGDTSCDENPCAENEYVSSNACAACAAGTTNEAGDLPSGSDTSCDENPCAENEYVSSNACAPCAAGTTNEAGDLPSGSDTSCDENPCAENEYVFSNACAACAAGTTNEAGDLPSGSDTSCDAIACEVNTYVSSHMCTPCVGYTNPAGDDAAGDDTSCSNFCAEDYYVSRGACVACDDRFFNEAGDDASGDDTKCDAEIGSSQSSQGSQANAGSSANSEVFGANLVDDMTSTPEGISISAAIIFILIALVLFFVYKYRKAKRQASLAAKIAPLQDSGISDSDSDADSVLKPTDIELQSPTVTTAKNGSVASNLAKNMGSDFDDDVPIISARSGRGGRGHKTLGRSKSSLRTNF